MDTQRFDSLTSNFAATSSRRQALRFLAAAAFGAGSLAIARHDDASAKRKGGKKHKRPYQGGGSQPAQPGKGLREICIPGQDVCGAGLQCGSPTTRHTCSSTVEGVDAWCCVPPGGRCSECDCCGNYYCAYDDNNNPTCVPNPEM